MCFAKTSHTNISHIKSCPASSTLTCAASLVFQSEGYDFKGRKEGNHFFFLILHQQYIIPLFI